MSAKGELFRVIYSSAMLQPNNSNTQFMTSHVRLLIFHPHSLVHSLFTTHSNPPPQCLFSEDLPPLAVARPKPSSNKLPKKPPSQTQDNSSRYRTTLFILSQLVCADIGTQKLNEHCFERCVPKPGSSLSSGETTCYTQCMEKYMSAWNTVSKQYINRIQREAGSGGIM